MEEELKNLGRVIAENKNSETFKEAFKALWDKYPSRRDEIREYAENCLALKTAGIDKGIEEIHLWMEIDKIKGVVSLSYIAKEYFGKSKFWLYRRIKGSTVNGKPARFTPDERRILQNARTDISNKIGSVRIV
jgi:hypothetical protein